MRKNYSNYFAILFVFCFGLILVFCFGLILVSCSNNDDDDKIKIEEITETALCLDGVRQDLTDNNQVTYFKETPEQLVVSFEASGSIFRMNFIGVKLGDIKQGKNLSKIKDFEYFLSFPGNSYSLSKTSENESKNKGTVGIMAVDTETNTIAIKFWDLYVISSKDADKKIKVNGTIISKLDKY